VRTQVVEWVNLSFAVFDKRTGALLYGPAAGNTLWSGFGGACQSKNNGDPIAQYDPAANRWVMTQFSVSTTPYLQCVAISQTADATGAWYRYAFQMPNFPRLSEARCMARRVLHDLQLVHQQQRQLHRHGCLRLQARRDAARATGLLRQCFQLSNESLLPADLDGATPPPPGAPNYLLNLGANALNLWRFHVDWTTSANSTFYRTDEHSGRAVHRSVQQPELHPTGRDHAGPSTGSPIGSCTAWRTATSGIMNPWW